MSTRSFFIALAIFHFVTMPSLAQYDFKKNFPNDGFLLYGSTGCHGLAVDPEGKIWIQPYGATNALVDSLVYQHTPTREIYVFWPDGTPASFSPIHFITVDGVTDTLTGSGRGLGTDGDGNILVSTFDKLYRIDYRTGEGMDKIVPQAGNSVTAAASDTAGSIYVTRVLKESGPINIIDASTFEITGNVVDQNPGYSRSLTVSQDGKTVYYAGYSNHCVYVYTSESGEPGTYSLTDSVLLGLDVESFARHPVTNNIWASSGSGMDWPNRHPSVSTSYSSHTWYAFDPGSGSILDSIKWNGVYDPYWQRPRAIAFSPTGDTAYVGMFGNDYYPMVQMFLSANLPAPIAGQYEPDSATILLLHMNEDGGDLVADSSGNGFDGLATGTTISRGRFGRSRKFNGSSDRISILSQPDLNPSPAITLEAWIKPSSFSSYNMVVRKNGPDGESGYLLGFASGGSILNFGINTKLELVTNSIVDADYFLDGRWHHIAGTYDGSVARIYVDGGLVDTDVFNQTIGTTSTDTLHIGSNGVFGQYFHGLIDEVRISNSVRTADDFSLPRPPEQISALPFGYQIQVAWEKVEGAYSAKLYRIYKGYDSTSFALSGETTVPFFTDYEYYGSTVYYRVSIVTEDGLESAPSRIVAVVPDSPPEYLNFHYSIQSATVYSALAPTWDAVVHRYASVYDGWTEPDGSGTFRRAYAMSGNYSLWSIEAIPGDAGGTTAATVGEYTVDRPKNFSVKYGLRDGRMTADASVRFVIQVDDSGDVTTILDTLMVDVAGWQAFQRTMDAWSDRRIVLRFITDPVDTTTEDWALWGEPLMTSYGPFPPPQEAEPNNTASEANIIAIGDSVDASLNPPGDVDYFRFTANAGDTVTVYSYDTGYYWIDRALRLHDTTGAQIAYMDAFSSGYQMRKNLILADSGAVFIRSSARFDTTQFPNMPPQLGRTRGQTSERGSSRSWGPDKERALRAGTPQSETFESTLQDTGSYRVVVREYRPSAPTFAYAGDLISFFDSVFVPIRVNPNGRSTTVYLDYGLTPSYGMTRTITGINGLDYQTMEIVLTDLIPDTTYYLMCRGTNVMGTTYQYYYYQFRTPPAPQGWTRVWMGTRETLRDVAMVTSSWGLMIGDTSVFGTRDGGRTWKRRTFLPGHYLMSLSVPDSLHAYLLAVWIDSTTFMYTQRIYTSLDGGVSWNLMWEPSPYFLFDICFPTPSTGFAVGEMGKIYRTSDGGSSWTERPIPTSELLYAIDFADSSQGIAVGGNGVILRTITSGIIWTLRPSPVSVYLNDVSFTDVGTAYAVGDGKAILKSTDGGSTWSKRGEFSGYGGFYGVACASDNLALTFDSYGGVVRTINGGTQWINESSGTTVELISGAYVNANVALIVGRSGVVLRNSQITSVDEEIAAVPKEYALEQNYPNPFNPSTTIRFSLPVQSHVRVEIYDLMGRRVVTILDEVKDAGVHSMVWNARVASGVYFYRFHAEGIGNEQKRYDSVKKMILIR